ncbi:MAG: hypothetical protein IPK68_13815 [Bdellovibrionales bacterium]|nr:hypothetical protein [Bdellovibrionales bacterium]
MRLDPRFNFLDRMALWAGLFGAILTGMLLWQGDYIVRYFLMKNHDQVEIGQILKLKGDVRRRLDQSLNWYPTDQSEWLFDGDKIFTGPNSDIQMKIGPTSILNLESNSLVTLRAQGNELLLDLKLGSLSTSSNSNQTIRLLHQNKVTTIRTTETSSEIHIEKSKDGDLSIISNTQEGEIEVEVAGQKSHLNNFQSLKIEKEEDKSSIEPIQSIEAVSAAQLPARWARDADSNDPSQTSDSIQKITLRFNSHIDLRVPASVQSGIVEYPKLAWSPLLGVAHYVLELSTKRDFSDPLQVNEVLKNHEFTWTSVRPGHYFWRVKALDSHEDILDISPTKELIVQVSAPEIDPIKLGNESTDLVSKLNLEKDIPIRWAKTPMASSYRIISGEKNILTRRNEFFLPLPPNRESEVKIAAVDEFGTVISDFSKERIYYQRTLILKPPTLLRPASRTTLLSFDPQQVNPLLFSWMRLPEIGEYEIQIARDPLFEKIIFTTKTMTNRLIFKGILPESETYWRIRSLFEANVSNWSETSSFQVQGPEAEGI